MLLTCRRERRAPVAARLPVVRRGRAAARAGVTALSGRTGRARPIWSRRWATSRRSARTGSRRTRRWSGSVPSAPWCAARSCARRPAAAGRAGDHAGAGQPGPGQPVAGAAAARRARHPAHGALRARGPRARQGRPCASGGASSTSCWCCGTRGWPVCGPTTSGCSSSATRCSSRRGARGARRTGDLRTLDVWDAHLAAAGAELLAARLELVAALGPLVARRTRGGRAGSAERHRRRSSCRSVARGPTPPLAPTTRAARRDALAAGARRCAGASSTAASPWSDRTATTSCSSSARCRPGLREPRRVVVVRPRPAPGVATTCCAPSRRGGEPVLILDDVFAELDTQRRRAARGRGRACRPGARHRRGDRRRPRSARRRPRRRDGRRGTAGDGERRGRPAAPSPVRRGGLEIAREALAASEGRGQAARPDRRLAGSSSRGDDRARLVLAVAPGRRRPAQQCAPGRARPPAAHGRGVDRLARRAGLADRCGNRRRDGPVAGHRRAGAVRPLRAALVRQVASWSCRPTPPRGPPSCGCSLPPSSTD